MEGALRRFATGIVVVWFPVKSAIAAEAFCGEVLALDPRKALRIDIAVDKTGDRLGAAGLLVVNPPYGFSADMAAALETVAPRLGTAARHAGRSSGSQARSSLRSGAVLSI